MLELAKLLLQRSLADRDGQHRTYSLLLDMNQIFESYICRLLQRLQTPTRRVQLQASGKSLLLQNGKKRFLLRPDAVVYESGQCETVLDTKWKQLDPDAWNHGIKQSDIYQMYAYTREYNSRRTILLYPRSSIFKQAAGGPEDNSIIHLPLGIYHFPPNGDPEPALEIHAIDIACNNREVLRQLSQIINLV